MDFKLQTNTVLYNKRTILALKKSCPALRDLVQHGIANLVRNDETGLGGSFIPHVRDSAWAFVSADSLAARNPQLQV